MPLPSLPPSEAFLQRRARLQQRADDEERDAASHSGADDDGGSGRDDDDDDDAGAYDDIDYEGYVSDGGADDDTLAATFAEPAPQKVLPLTSLVVVDNLPVVEQDKYAKLVAVVTNFFKRFNRDQDKWDMKLFMPWDNGEPRRTKGYAFLHMQDERCAQHAVQHGDKYQLDKRHTFRVNLLSDFDRYMALPDEYKPATAPPPQPVENLRAWQLDARSREQFVVRYGDMTQVHWQDSKMHQPTMAFEAKSWTESVVFWSPQGNLIGTFHVQGIILWGGPKFAKVLRLAHQNVDLVDFSPCERYVVTCNSQRGEPMIYVWDVSTGKKLTEMPYATTSAATGGPAVWPELQWSHDGRYFARLGEGRITVAEVPSLERKVFKIAGVRDCAWSPAAHMIAYWVPETEDRSARVAILGVADACDLCTKNLVNVTDCTIMWHPDGTYLCVQARRHTKTKKNEFTNFDLFRVKEKNMPVDQVEFQDKVDGFAWEPKGSRFSVIHGTLGARAVSFYDMEAVMMPGASSAVSSKRTSGLGKSTLGAKGGAGAERPKGAIVKLEKIVTLAKRTASHCFWSPQGGSCVLAGLTSDHKLEFYDVDEQLTLASKEHVNCTNVEWDPSGRYVCSYVNVRGGLSDRSFVVWAWTGVELYARSVERMLMFQWRPRPKASRLSEQQLREVRKQLKKIGERFAKEDAELLLARDQSDAQQRLAKRNAWAEYRARRQRYAESLVERGLMPPPPGASDMVTVTVYDEEVLDEKTVVLQDDD